jgi:hypothetical protein
MKSHDAPHADPSPMNNPRPNLSLRPLCVGSTLSRGFATLKADKPKEKPMTMLIKTLATVAVGTALATSAFAQSAREFRGGPRTSPSKRSPHPS